MGKNNCKCLSCETQDETIGYILENISTMEAEKESQKNASYLKDTGSSLITERERSVIKGYEHRTNIMNIVNGVNLIMQ